MIKKAYEAGVRRALEDAGLVKKSAIFEREPSGAVKGLQRGAFIGGTIPLAAIIASLATKGRLGGNIGSASVPAGALLGGGVGAVAGALFGD